jgi:glc operon protein GlcG
MPVRVRIRFVFIHFASGMARHHSSGGNMFSKLIKAILVLTAAASFSAAAQTPPPYGEPIGIEAARKAVAAAVAESKKNNWGMAIGVVDTGGHLVYFERMDNTQAGSANIALDKAKTAVLFRRPSKAFEDALAAGGAGLRILTLGVTAVEGGLPIVVNGKVIGAIGASGGTAQQDGVAAGAGVNALK